jgi:uncharacterized protein YabN with tetrapyrrole methylase and pyrophosphatase domain
VQIESSQEVLKNWEALKKAERGDESLLSHVPQALPALAQAQSLQSRASKAGLGPAPVSSEAVTRALHELTSSTATADRLGDLLFAVAGYARQHDLDAEESLRLALRRFRADVAAQEETAREAS